MDVDGIDTGDYAEYMTVAAGDLQAGVYLIGTDAEQDDDSDEDLDLDLDDEDSDDDIEIAHVTDGAPRLVY